MARLSIEVEENIYKEMILAACEKYGYQKNDQVSPEMFFKNLIVAFMKEPYILRRQKIATDEAFSELKDVAIN